MKLFEAASRQLREHGVNIIFGLIGDANLFLMDCFCRDGGRFVGTAHESSAVLMALGYGQVTGEVGVASVTHGPGLTNTITALIEGVKGATPMLLICGDTPETDRDNFQSVQQREYIAAAGAGFEQLTAPSTLASDLKRALRRAILERRPIVFNMPADFMWQEVEYEFKPLTLSDNRVVVPTSDDLDEAVGIIAAARKPVVLAGRSAIDVDSREALLRLAERIGAPVATTLKARGLFFGEAFDAGVMGTLSTDAATEVFLEADCIIAFGAGLNKYTMGHGSFVPGKRIVQVNLDHAELGKNQKINAGLIGNAALTAERIIELLDMAEIEASGFRTEELKDKLANAVVAPRLSKDVAEGTVDIRAALLALDKVLPTEKVVVQDGGRFMVEAWKSISVRDPRSYVHSVNYAAIGHGLGEAIGAAVGSAKPTVLVAGDGGFMLSGWSEFNTAVRESLDLIVIICNDSAYGAEHIQFRKKDMDPSLSIINWMDFAPVAEAMGGEGYTIRSTNDLSRVGEIVARRKKPLLIDVKLDPESLLSITF